MLGIYACGWKPEGQRPWEAAKVWADQHAQCYAPQPKVVSETSTAGDEAVPKQER